MNDLIETILDNQDAFLRGIALTLGLLALSGAIGFALAVPLALARVSRARIFGRLAGFYILIFRGTPLLAQLFLIYYGLAQFDWVRGAALWPILREAWPCALIALSLNLSAYIAEVLRGGILAAPAGEREAALSMGMGPFLLYRRIILPRAFAISLPALGNEIILQLKSTALVSTITLLDITGVARRIATRTYTIDALLIAGIIYVVLTAGIAGLFRLTEKRINRHIPA